jgi:hypothetical protein
VVLEDKMYVVGGDGDDVAKEFLEVQISGIRGIFQTKMIQMMKKSEFSDVLILCDDEMN